MEDTKTPTNANTSSGTRNTIADGFDKGKHLFSTRASECYEGTDRRDGAKILIWVLRYPLDPNSEEARLFVSRLEKIQTLRIPSLEFLRFGVDASGTAFLAVKYVELKPVIDSTWIPMQLEEYFMASLKAVRELHLVGLCLEDVGESTFLLTPDNQLVLAGLMGDFEAGARQTAMLPPQETLHYVAPDQKSGVGANPYTDIYSLGVFGYRLFTGRYLHGDRAKAISDVPVHTAPSPSVVRSDLPNWVDDVLGRCLESKPSSRYANAGELLSVIEQAVRSGATPGGTSPWSRQTASVSIDEIMEAGEKEDLISAKAKSGEDKDEQLEEQERVNELILREEDEEHEQETTSKSFSFLVLMIALATGFGIAGFVFLSIGSLDSAIEESSKVETDDSSLTGEDPIAFMAEYASPELKEQIYIISSSDETLEDRKDALAKIASSSDPTSFGMLVTFIQNSNESAVRSETKRLIVLKVRENELRNSARIVEEWIGQSFQAQGGSVGSTNILRAIDIGRPIRARKESLKQAYQKEPLTALRLAAALSLDSEKEDFVSILRSFIAQEHDGLDLSNRGLGVLLMSHSALSDFVTNNSEEIIKEFSDDDLKWALLRSVDEDSDKKMLKPLAKEIAARKMLSPYRTIFLQALLENLPAQFRSHPLADELVRGALGEITMTDVQKFARWDSIESERVLLAVCASSDDQDAAVQAFDILARKTLTTEPAGTLVSWVKGKFWDYRQRLVKAVGILSLPEAASSEDVNFAFNSLMPFAKGGLFRTLTSTGDLKLVRESVERLGEITPSGDLIILLQHDDQLVRIEAVKALKGRNELAVLQAILKAYERETDDSVRQVYHEYHWVTRDRNNIKK